MRQEKETGFTQSTGDKSLVKTLNGEMEKRKPFKDVICLKHTKSGKTEQVFAQKDENNVFEETGKLQ
jgi:hypothetical protein